MARPTLAPTALAGAVAVTAVCVLPSFLVGALAVQMRQDLEFSAGSIGPLTAAFFGGGVVTSALLGRLSQRLGADRSMRLAAGAAAVVMTLVAAVVDRYASLLALLAMGGVVSALAQPAANLAISRAVPTERLGLALGIKQSAIPVSTLLGGFAVPLVAVPFGWRWAFAGGAAAAALVTALAPASPSPPPPSGGAEELPVAEPVPSGEVLHRPALLLLSVAMAFGAAAAGSLGSFLVSSAVHVGIEPSAAGVLFGVSSALGLGTRVVAGHRADRRGEGHLAVVATMLAVGAVAYLGLAVGHRGLTLVAAPLAFMVGWGWPGLFHLSIVRHHRGLAGAATGITQTGTYVGALVGPLVFGALVDGPGYGWAWTVSAALSVAGAALMVAGRRRLRAALGLGDRRVPPPHPG